jgi:hypothetical protein
VNIEVPPKNHVFFLNPSDFRSFLAQRDYGTLGRSKERTLDILQVDRGKLPIGCSHKSITNHTPCTSCLNGSRYMIALENAYATLKSVRFNLKKNCIPDIIRSYSPDANTSVTILFSSISLLRSNRRSSLAVLRENTSSTTA